MVLQAKHSGDKDEKPMITSVDLEQAELCWIKDVQNFLKNKEKLRSWK